MRPIVDQSDLGPESAFRLLERATRPLLERDCAMRLLGVTDGLADGEPIAADAASAIDGLATDYAESLALARSALAAPDPQVPSVGRLEEPCEYLQGARILARLLSLGLQDCDLTDEGARAILESPHLRSLRSLNFSGNLGVTDATAQLILSQPRKWHSVALFTTAVSDALRTELAARCARDSTTRNGERP